MMKIFLGNAMWQLIKQSDAVSQLVLLVLLSMSVICWTVFFYKVILLRIKKNQMKKALAHLKNVNSLEDMLSMASEFSGTLPGYFLSKNLLYLKTVLEGDISGSKPVLNTHGVELAQQHMYQTLDDIVHNEESYLPILSTSAAVSPLLGLFGTVWGLVHAFIRISERQTADITTVAPGIAEALMTTLTGLIVAIPALVMFNYLTVQVRFLEQQFIIFSDKMSLIIQKLSR